METHRNHLGIKSPAPTGKKALGKETHTREERVLGEAAMTDPLRRFRIRSMGLIVVMVAIDSGRLARITHNLPVHIWPQLFAPDGAVGICLDVGAVLSWNTASRLPVTDDIHRNVEVICQSGNRKGSACGFRDCIHDAHFHMA